MRHLFLFLAFGCFTCHGLSQLVSGGSDKLHDARESRKGIWAILQGLSLSSMTCLWVDRQTRIRLCFSVARMPGGLDPFPLPTSLEGITFGGARGMNWTRAD